MPRSDNYKERLKKKEKRDKERARDESESGSTKPRRRKKSKDPPGKEGFSLANVSSNDYSSLNGLITRVVSNPDSLLSTIIILHKLTSRGH